MLPLVIGAIALYIASEQKNINKRKLNLDLYDRRYKIYLETRNFILKVLDKKTNISTEVLSDFRTITKEKYFLFGSDIIKYFDELDKNLACLEISDDNYKSTTLGSEESIRFFQEREVFRNWFINGEGNIEKIFLKYLDFTNLK